MTLAACAGVLQYLMNGASGAIRYFARRRRKTLASRDRPVPRLKPGSTALKCSRGVSRTNASAAASSHCFDVAQASKPAWVEQPGCHSPRALASAELQRPHRSRPASTR